MDDNNETGHTVGAAGEIIKDVLSNISNRKDNEINGLPTGFIELDKMLSGLNKRNLIVVAGHPGVGTTAFALSITEHLSIQKNIPVLYFSIQLSKEQLMERLLLSHARIDFHKARRGELDKEEWDRVNKSANLISSKPIYIDETPGLKCKEIEAKYKELIKHKNIGCVIVDFLQTMRVEGRLDLDEKGMKQISGGLKMLSASIDTPIVLLAELNFDLYHEEDEKCCPRLKDLGDAAIVERYADVIMLIDRKDYYGYWPPDDGHTEIEVLRNRKGPTGMAAINFECEFARFENITSRNK